MASPDAEEADEAAEPAPPKTEAARPSSDRAKAEEEEQAVAGRPEEAAPSAEEPVESQVDADPDADAAEEPGRSRIPLEARRAAYLRFGAAAGLWTAGAAVIAAVNLGRLLLGPGAGSGLVPVLHVATLAGLVAGALFALAMLVLWRARIERTERRRVRWRRERRYSWTRAGLVLLFGFLAGTWLWTLDAQAVPLWAVGLGFPLMVFAALVAWHDMPDRGRLLVAVGGALALMHPAAVVFLAHAGNAATAAGFALVAVGILLAERRAAELVERKEELEAARDKERERQREAAGRGPRHGAESVGESVGESKGGGEAGTSEDEAAGGAGASQSDAADAAAAGGEPDGADRSTVG